MRARCVYVVRGKRCRRYAAPGEEICPYHLVWEMGPDAPDRLALVVKRNTDRAVTEFRRFLGLHRDRTMVQVEDGVFKEESPSPQPSPARGEGVLTLPIAQPDPARGAVVSGGDVIEVPYVELVRCAFVRRGRRCRLDAVPFTELCARHLAEKRAGETRGLVAAVILREAPALLQASQV